MTFDDKKFFVVTGSGNCTIFKLDDLGNFTGVVGIFYADFFLADSKNCAVAEINQAVVNAMCGKNFSGKVNAVTFGNAAQIEFDTA